MLRLHAYNKMTLCASMYLNKLNKSTLMIIPSGAFLRQGGDLVWSSAIVLTKAFPKSKNKYSV